MTGEHFIAVDGNFHSLEVAEKFCITSVSCNEDVF